jgi:hypothetical protein
MKKTFFLLVFILIQQLGFSQLNSEKLMQFKYKEIPFEKKQSEIVALIPSNTKIENSKDINIEDFYGYVAIRDYFKKGVYSFSGIGSYFAGDCAMKQTLTEYPNWNSIESIDLYYVKTFNSKDEPTLFLVRKSMNSEYGSLINVFNALQSAVTKQILIKPKILTSDFIFNTGNAVNSKIAIWDAGNNIVFLMVMDNGFSRYPVFLYLSKTGWNKYLKSSALFEKNKKANENKKADKSVNEF